MRFIVHGLFGNVPVGGIFQLQRTIKNAGAPAPITWLKVSTRTARVNGNGAVFYFGKADNVWLEEGVRLTTNKETGDA
jgi:hypothetical protein